MIHVSQVPTYLFRLLTLALVTGPTLWAQEPLWFQKSKLAPATKQSTASPLWFNEQEVKSAFPASQATGNFWFQSRPDKKIQVAQVAPENEIFLAQDVLANLKVPPGVIATEQRAPTSPAEPATRDAPQNFAGPDSMPSTWIRNAVLAQRANSKNDSGETLAAGQKTSARANNKRALESTLTDIKLSSLSLKSGEIAISQRPLDLNPTPPAVVTIQLPKLDGADLIRQLVADKNDQGPVVNVEFIDVAEQTGSNIDDANTRSDAEEIAAAMGSESKASKFRTEAMIGPLEDTNELFSRVQISDRYEAYAAHVPANRTREEDFLAQSPWPFDTYTWISPVFYYQPLYFEQPNLERYGLGTKRWLQPAASSIHFFGSIPLLPYKVLTQHPRENYYTLGNNRPGDCVPFQRATILGQSHVGEILYYWIPGSGY